MNVLGLYIHIPFCTRKCNYCDFVSYPNMEDDFDAYINALIKEAMLYESHLKTRKIDTVFIGGGTPSLLSPSQIEKLVSGLSKASNFQPSEFTIECNPETVTKDKIASYINVGINRISIGLQTHDNDILQAIGRRHTFQDFRHTYDLVQNQFDNINIDTIFGLPNQSIKNFKETIQKIINLSPTHVSSYALKLEQDIGLFKTYDGVDDETDRKMYHIAIEMLTESGYRLYETSNFAKKEYECVHNLKYWTGAEYLGLGISAHSFLDGKTRISNTTNLNFYIERLRNDEKPSDIISTMTIKEIKEEYIMLRLRLADGIEFSHYNDNFNSSFTDEYSEAIDWAISHRLVEQSKFAIKPTIRGFDLQNTLISKFMKKM